MNATAGLELAYDIKYKGFRVQAWWGSEPNASIVIYRDEQIYRDFPYPAYRIYNIAAHFREMVDALLAEEARTKPVEEPA